MQKRLPDFNELMKGASVLNALDYPLRMQMLKYIHKKGAATVTEIFIALRTEQSVVSQQLRILRETGLVTTKRQGKYIYYSVSLSRVERVNKLIGNFFRSSSRDYIQEFAEFTNNCLNDFRIEPKEINSDAIDNWLQNMSTGLKDYHKILMKRAEELMQEANKKGKSDTDFPKAEISRIVSEGLKLFLKKYTQ